MSKGENKGGRDGRRKEMKGRDGVMGEKKRGRKGNMKGEREGKKERGKTLVKMYFILLFHPSLSQIF